ncbi:uncharacterized protein LOC130625242 [Hydractinia symbiolongicarpus]|uniref:uncharacterized protein LOC130625242 n=1 Tax=Hydractinia symbiolongicarpus TaxID=13093 RepID=UPI00254EB340|nr:uncharacterized protein LOC130625242 [Hydractinia symbiolongicarpus]
MNSNNRFWCTAYGQHDGGISVLYTLGKKIMMKIVSWRSLSLQALRSLLSLIKLQCKPPVLSITVYHIDYCRLTAELLHYLVSAISGSLTASYLSQKFGRRIVLLISLLQYFIGAVTMGAAENIWMLLVRRFIVVLAISKLYLYSEIFIKSGEKHWLDKCIDFTNFKIQCQLIHIVNHQVEKLMACSDGVLGFYVNHVELDRTIFQMTVTMLPGTRWSSCNTKGIFVRVIKTQTTRRVLLVGCGLQAFQQLFAINTVVYYSATIIEMAGDDSPTSTFQAPIIYTQGCASYKQCFSCVQDKSYEKVCPTSYAWLAEIAMMFHLFMHASGVGPMPWAINAEIYPLWARSFETSASTATNWFCNLLVSLTFLYIMDWLTRPGAFFLYAGLSLIGFIFLVVLLPETKGKKLENVEELFSEGIPLKRF